MSAQKRLKNTENGGCSPESRDSESDAHELARSVLAEVAAGRASA